MSPPNNNPFVIPSLIPPSASSSLSLSTTGMNHKENVRCHLSCNNNEFGTNKPSSSLLVKSRKDTGASKGHSTLFQAASPDITHQRQSRALHAKEGKRKAFSPIENFTSGTKKSMSSQTKKKGIRSPFSPSPSFTSPVPSLPRPSASIDRYGRSDKKRVLLFGETMESLFCLNRVHSTEEQYELCTSIVDGTCINDPAVWCRVLELARIQYHEMGDEKSGAKSNNENLVRLHRRATLRFSLRDQQDARDSSSSSSVQKRSRGVFEIWLSYAKVHASVGNLDEARRTFRFMEDNLMSFTNVSSSEDNIDSIASIFYLSYADFESKLGQDKIRAQQVLLRGIKDNAEPVRKLERALTALDCSDNASEETTKRFRLKGTPASEKKSSVSIGSIKFEINQSPAMEKLRPSLLKRELLGQEHLLKSPKRHKTSPDAVQEPKPVKDELGEKFDNQTKITGSTSKKGGAILKGSFKGSSTSNDVNAIPTNVRSTSQGKPPVNKKRLALTSRLARKGLSGKAKRVDCSVTIDEDDFSSDDETQINGVTAAQKTEDLMLLDENSSASKPSKKVKNFKKLDLSYMWAWDPNKKGKGQNQVSEKSSDGSNSIGSGQSTSNTQLSVLDTLGSGSASEDSSEGKTSATISEAKNSTKEEKESTQKLQPAMNGNERVEIVVNEGSTKNPPTQTTEKECSQIDEASKAKREALVAKANLEFLPLVHEDNILRVQGSTYAKLGVIGKGGSCKVYRALSKKCSVVAIKKVRLAGMDRKAIEGYANEISLLKRLRGNPAIIQMYDSEVDIQRKSIYVVMELGEVDLNQVLQQRAVSKTSRSLNMNFIRLTWQQMLSAVHCIHEERIIHSDLKPANFLFVRGALKLIDFGIAKAIVNDDTTNIYRENHIGTLNYMSPEAILDTGSGQDGPRMKIGRASDVWSLGCILYEMVYGKTPFYKLHFIQKLQAIVNPKHKIYYPEEEEAEAAIDAMKLCLRRNPEDRPPIVGKDGLLNEHWFLHSKRKSK